jgi:DNA-binding CsgD family transcriptional regulator
MEKQIANELAFKTNAEALGYNLAPSALDPELLAAKQFKQGWDACYDYYFLRFRRHRSKRDIVVDDNTILVALLEGKTNKQIAADMSTSEQVVKNKLGRLFKKFGFRNRLELALHYRSQSNVTAQSTSAGA